MDAAGAGHTLPHQPRLASNSVVTSNSNERSKRRTIWQARMFNTLTWVLWCIRCWVLLGAKSRLGWDTTSAQRWPIAWQMVWTTWTSCIAVMIEINSLRVLRRLPQHVSCAAMAKYQALSMQFVAACCAITFTKVETELWFLRAELALGLGGFFSILERLPRRTYFVDCLPCMVLSLSCIWGYRCWHEDELCAVPSMLGSWCTFAFSAVLMPVYLLA